MKDFRSKSYNNEGMQMHNAYYDYNGTHFSDTEAAPHHKAGSNPGGMQDLRCYSASHATSSAPNNGQIDMVVAGSGVGDPWKFKKGKSSNGMVSKSWSFNDPELQRKKRVASYKAYSVEGKVKGSIKKSFRWLKERYTQMVYGYR